MSQRQTALLALLGVILVGVLFWFFLWQPKSARIAEIETEIEAIEAQKIQLQQRIARLEDVRNRAPELEAAIVAAESVVPRDVAIPAALRQLVLAADESGVELTTVSPTRPTALAVEGATPGAARLDVTLQVTGGYFQMVDFLRRIEDPTISPRGFVWTQMSVSPSAYPTLSATISGTMFAVLPVVGEAAAPAASPTEGDDQPTDDTTLEEGTS